jgi:SAM-dependent methyltransferase
MFPPTRPCERAKRALARGSRCVSRAEAHRRIAGAYDHVGRGYADYADGAGEAQVPSRFAHADTIVWRAIRAAIEARRAAGASSLRVLDAGCGPGTWIERVATHANRIGLGLEVIGFDIARRQLAIAREHLRSWRPSCPRLAARIDFLAHDLAQPLPWPDRHFDLVLCNYVVLNHLDKSSLPRALAELCRVASFRVIATLRALASPPTGCITGTERIREYHQDCQRGELRLVLKDGTDHVLTFNLYSAATLRALFEPLGSVLELRAIDLFLTRFASDPHWTANHLEGLEGRRDVLRQLKAAEENLCRRPGWIDHGTHVLAVVRPHAETAARHGARAVPEDQAAPGVRASAGTPPRRP